MASNQSVWVPNSDTVTHVTNIMIQLDENFKVVLRIYEPKDVYEGRSHCMPNHVWEYCSRTLKVLEVAHNWLRGKIAQNAWHVTKRIKLILTNIEKLLQLQVMDFEVKFMNTCDPNITSTQPFAVGFQGDCSIIALLYNCRKVPQSIEKSSPKLQCKHSFLKICILMLTSSNINLREIWS